VEVAVTLLIAVLPWLILLIATPVIMWRHGPRVRSFGPPRPDEAPLVSIIVPARNEARNISTCVASLLNSVYPRREVIVVDDDSVDGTGEIVRILEEHAQGSLRIVKGEPLPPGWLGKPWACWQGYRIATGDLLLFTDADTRHDDALLGHAVGALRSREADLVSVLPRQLMGSFWERLILPHIFTLIMFRFPNLNRVNRTRIPRNVFANGQFMLVRRDAYEAIGGHEALRGEVVDDQRIAQVFVARGRRIFLAYAEALIETRMYRSLRDIVEGWSKNIATGARHAVPAWLSSAMPWLMAVFIGCFWLVPPVVLIASFFTSMPGGVEAWSLLVTALSLLFWLVLYIRLRVSPLYVFGYPVASIVVIMLVIRSARRGSHVEWKGRSYDLEPPAAADRTVPRAS
jgi:chlorobactene glucosyltransferase